MADSNRSSGTGAQLVTHAGIVGVAIALFMGGFHVGRNSNEDLVDLLEEKNQESEKRSSQLSAQVSAMKLETQRCATSAASSGVVADGAGTKVVVDEGDATVSLGGSLTQSSGEKRVVVQQGQTESLFEEKLFISLVGTSFEGSPFRYRAFVKVGVPGKKYPSDRPHL